MWNFRKKPEPLTPEEIVLTKLYLQGYTVYIRCWDMPPQVTATDNERAWYQGAIDAVHDRQNLTPEQMLAAHHKTLDELTKLRQDYGA
jgi:NAD(P)H-dependent FMN reductase